MNKDWGWEDVPNMPEWWEKRAHLERYEWAAKDVPLGRVADCACGMGYGTKMLRDAGHDAAGFDASHEAVALARKRYPGCEFHVMDAQHAEFPDYTTLVCFETLEHLVNPYAFVEKLRVKKIFASAPIIPTVGVNPHHRHDFKLEGAGSFRDMIEQRFRIVDSFLQRSPDGTPVYQVVRGLAKTR